jgi:hypothetical protein
MGRSRWLSRDLGATAPYYKLCVTEDDFVRVAKRFTKRPKDALPPWVTPGCNATVHRFYTEGDMFCVVCVDSEQVNGHYEMAGVMAHEAWHVVENYFDSIGEDEPASEQTAYAIGRVAAELTVSYLEQVSPPWL